MAKKNQQKRLLLVIVVIVSLLTMAVGGYYLVTAMLVQKQKEVATVEKNDNYFKIRKNATAYQRELYQELNDAMNAKPQDEEAIALAIAKSFVADYYTWTNKLRFNDVGGLQFFHKDIAVSAMNKSLEYFYYDLQNHLADGTVKESLEVTEASATATPVEYVLQELIYNQNYEVTQEEKKASGFDVTITWKYKEPTVMDVDSFQQSAILTIVKDDEGIFRIVEVQYEA